MRYALRMKISCVGWAAVLVLGAVGARGQGIMLPASYYPVQGAPFTLTLRVESDQARFGPRERSLRILRDSAGRQRYESAVVDGTPEAPTAIIYDLVAGRMIKLDSAAKTAELSPIKVGKAVALDPAVQNSMPPATAPEGQTLLGTRKLAGLEAWGEGGTKTTTRPDGASRTMDRETWFSVNYRIPMLQVLRPEGGVATTQRVMDFDPSEPDPALFRIPDGYTVSNAPPPPEPAPGTVRIGGNVSAPRVLSAAEPEFSEEARRSKIGGSVMVYLVVDEQGLPRDVRVTKGLGHGLDEKAVEAVRKYRFKPATRDGVPVKVEMHVAVNFQVF